jgi:LmbE family N-acetylglucosaminyl deacetylase
MTNRNSEDVVFETIASCVLAIAALVITALLYQLITVVVPLFESMMVPRLQAQGAAKTLVAVFAHADDEGAAAPILARYAREGVRTYLIIATDGAEGGMHTTIPRGPELARARTEEARCAADALGARPPILLGFPDGKLGDYVTDPMLLYRLTERIAAELKQLHPDAVLTWGPDGGTGHPDHRLVSNIATQLLRAAAPGVPDRLFYMNLPAEGMRAMNPQRGAPPFLIPEAKYFTVRVPFAQRDFDAAQRAMLCHRSQFDEDVVKRIAPIAARVWNGEIALIPAVPTARGTDLFQ